MPMGPVSGLTMHCWGIGGPAGSGKHSWKTGDPWRMGNLNLMSSVG